MKNLAGQEMASMLRLTAVPRVLVAALGFGALVLAGVVFGWLSPLAGAGGPQVDLSVSKDDEDPSFKNSDLPYTLTVRNNEGLGGATATGVTVVDDLPASVTFVAADAGCSFSAANQRVTCNVGSLLPQQQSDLDVTVRPKELGTITNFVEVKGDQDDPRAGNNDDVETTTIETFPKTMPDLNFLDKADNAGLTNTVAENQDLTYTFSVLNQPNQAGDSSDEATGVRITDQLPAGVEFISGQGCTESGGTVTCSLGTINEGSSVQRQITVRARVPGEITNTASVSADQTDVDANNNNASEATTITEANPNLELGKSDQADPVKENQALAYTLSVTNVANPDPNDGVDNATGVTITDTLPAGVEFVSASEGCSHSAADRQVTCAISGDLDEGQSAQRQIVVVPREPGLITNTAKVSGGEPNDPDMTNNDDIERTTVDPAIPNLAIKKSADDDPVSAADGLTYKLTATNALNAADGTDNATGVAITDTLPAEVQFVSASSGCTESGGTVTCNVGDLNEGDSVKREIVVQPLQQGKVSNTASIAGNETDPALSDNQATEETTVEAECDGRDAIRIGTLGPDEITGTEDRDVILAGEGDDVIAALKGDDFVCAGAGSDDVDGAGGADKLLGEDGADKLTGGGGRDRLAGGKGDDKVIGEKGKDDLRGNKGDDKLKARDGKRDKVTCGGGKDKAVVDEEDRVAKNCEDVREP